MKAKESKEILGSQKLQSVGLLVITESYVFYFFLSLVELQGLA